MYRTNRKKQGQTGFSILELVVVIVITLVVAGITVPSAVQTWQNMQLRAASAQVADLMQHARLQAARTNTTIPIRYQLANGMQQVYLDYNNNGVWDQQTEPLIIIPKMTAAAGAPNGGAGAPTAYVDPTSPGQPCDNTCTLAFSPRGLPCNLVGVACTTPAASSFVYYFQNGNNGWSAVLVSKAGRTKALVWNGTSWR
ncbi:MAG TPA: prepilin-type N-terminal cleavage/methylation domain-containing protein [Candidatus Dormibacteraeota bacterium]|nr:prepilin-type N-terminal cleavage/methylation domain-containing protein [Candidatus Dormibacteraeota bacterium]